VKRTEELDAILEEELSTLVEVVDDGRRRRLPKRRVIIRQWVNKTATGDLKALTTLVALMENSA
jgi:hypothetical protein